MIIVRVLMAIILSQAVTFLVLWLWSSVPLWWAIRSSPDQVSLDATVLAISLATNHIMLAAEILVLPPVFLACFIARYTKKQRFKAACAGLLTSLLAIFIWQGILSLITGENVAMRYAKTDPLSVGDAIGIAIIFILSAIATVHFIPFKGKKA